MPQKKYSLQHIREIMCRSMTFKVIFSIISFIFFKKGSMLERLQLKFRSFSVSQLAVLQYHIFLMFFKYSRIKIFFIQKSLKSIFKDKRLSTYKSLLGQLPDINHATIRKLLGHLYTVSSQVGLFSSQIEPSLHCVLTGRIICTLCHPRQDHLYTVSSQVGSSVHCVIPGRIICTLCPPRQDHLYTVSSQVGPSLHCVPQIGTSVHCVFSGRTICILCPHSLEFL